MRRPAAWAFILLTKITPGVGLLWFAVRREWRNLAIALVATAVIVGVSFVLAPGLWSDFLEASRTQIGATVNVPRQAAPIPLPLRMAVAAVLVIWGARTDRAWVLPIAVGLSVPFLWWNAFAVMVAAIPLAGWRPSPAPGAARDAGAEHRARRLRPSARDERPLDAPRPRPSGWRSRSRCPRWWRCSCRCRRWTSRTRCATGDRDPPVGQLPADRHVHVHGRAARPWTDQQWLAQVLLALGYRVGGWEALAVLRAALVAAMTGLLVAGRGPRAGRRPRTASILALLAFLLAAPALALRPQLFAIVMFAGAAAARGRARPAPAGVPARRPCSSRCGRTSTAASSWRRCCSATRGWTTWCAAGRPAGRCAVLRRRDRGHARQPVRRRRLGVRRGHRRQPGDRATRSASGSARCRSRVPGLLFYLSVAGRRARRVARPGPARLAGLAVAARRSRCSAPGPSAASPGGRRGRCWSWAPRSPSAPPRCRIRRRGR